MRASCHSSIVLNITFRRGQPHSSHTSFPTPIALSSSEPSVPASRLLSWNNEPAFPVIQHPLPPCSTSIGRPPTSRQSWVVPLDHRHLPPGVRLGLRVSIRRYSTRGTQQSSCRKHASPSRARQRVPRFHPLQYPQTPLWWASCTCAIVSDVHGLLTDLFCSSFLQFVSDRVSFDAQLGSFVQATWVQDK